MTKNGSPTDEVVTSPNSSHQVLPPRRVFLNLQPALPWTAILGLIVLSTVFIVGGAGKLLNFVFPIGTLAIAILLYFRASVLYLGFCWWINFLAPCIRRLADFRGGFTEPSPILLAPYLVVSVSIIAFWQYFPRTARHGAMPFGLCLSGLIYATVIGLINQPVVTVIKASLDWITPIFFGFYLFVHWQDYPQNRDNLKRVFVWGVLLMGVYGVFQYLVLPQWDRFWITNTQFQAGGSGFDVTNPQPLLVRVFSTMNSPEPFAAVISGALLLLLNTQSIILLPAASVGYLALLLSLVRASWLGWLVGVVSLFGSLRPKFQMRLVMTIVVMSLCLIPLATIEPFSTVIQSRIESLSNVQEDGSASGRQAFFKASIDTAVLSFVGDGIGGSSYDNTLLAMLFNFGWIGTLPILIGMLFLVFQLFQSTPGNFDPFIASARAILLTVLVRLPVNTSLTESSGLLFWTFLGLGLAAQKYQKLHSMTIQQQTKVADQNLI